MMKKSETHQQPKNKRNNNKDAKFISVRWRFITPLFIVVLLVAMIGTYILTHNISGGLEVSQTNVLLQSSRSVADRAAQLYDYHRQEAQRVAFTIGVPEAVHDGQATTLEPILKSIARINDLDSIIVTDTSGHEILGIQRVETPDSIEFALSTGTNLGDEAIISSVVDDAFVGATAFLHTPGGVMLFTAVPVSFSDEFVGIALVGQNLDAVLEDLQSSAIADLSLYGPDGALLHTTFAITGGNQSLLLSHETFRGAIQATHSIPVNNLQIDNADYQAAYQPFNFGPSTLGVVAAFMSDNIPFITATGRQLTALLLSLLTGVAVVMTFIGIDRFAHRADKIKNVADDLAAGMSMSRTRMKPSDEVGAAGHALDKYAEYVQVKQDALRVSLRRQRRETTHLLTVFQSIPEGVVVQDMEGRVMMMNDKAHAMLGSQRVFRSRGLHELAGVVGNELGKSLAPGIYTLGEPHHISMDNRMMSVQAAAVMSAIGYRVGTVILLRDITAEVRTEQKRDIMLQRITIGIQRPLSRMGSMGARSKSDMVSSFAREVSRQAIALQKMIIDIRELAFVDAASVQRRQRALDLETLIWAIANEWRQVAQANNLTLHIIIENSGLYVLGDEKRLRWAIGNIIDNAIKYNPPGGALTLEIKPASDGMANLRIRDNGVGIIREERQYAFTRFYRGTPTTADGEILKVPGMGQGLFIAKQIFEAHNGSIYIKSSPRIGTAVYMSVPLTAPVGLELPRFRADMEGETMQLPEGFLVEIEDDYSSSDITRPTSPHTE